MYVTICRCSEFSAVVSGRCFHDPGNRSARSFGGIDLTSTSFRACPAIIDDDQPKVGVSASPTQRWLHHRYLVSAASTCFHVGVRARKFQLSGGFAMLRLDYVSCVLTVISTLLVGRKLWQGWIIAGANSALLCLIGIRTAQFGFVPANLFCIALYSYNLRTWKK